MQMPVPDPAILALKSRLVERLLGVLPADAVIHDETETRAYECDALTAYRCAPLAVVLPRTTAEVAAITGHKSLQMLEHYGKKRSQPKIARIGMGKWQAKTKREREN